MFPLAVITGVLIETDTAILERFVDCVEATIDEQPESLHAGVERFEADLSPQERQTLHDRYGDYRRSLTQILPNTLRLWAFNTLWGALVYRLKDICRQLRRRRGLLDHISEMSNRCVRRARRYLRKQLGASFPDQDALWNELLALNWIRKKVLRDAGRIEKRDEKKPSFRYIQAHPQLLYVRKGQLVAQPELLPHVVGLFNSLFTNLLAGMRQDSRRQDDRRA
jgi:hypothetical protein